MQPLMQEQKKLQQKLNQETTSKIQKTKMAEPQNTNMNWNHLNLQLIYQMKKIITIHIMYTNKDY